MRYAVLRRRARRALRHRTRELNGRYRRGLAQQKQLILLIAGRNNDDIESHNVFVVVVVRSRTGPKASQELTWHLTLVTPRLIIRHFAS